MSEEEKESSQAARIAPAPPPPAHLVPVFGGTPPKGFDPKAGWVAFEMVFAALVIVGLGVAAVFFGGTLASWMTPLIPVSLDRSLGEAAQKQASLSSNECTNPAAREYVEKIAGSLLAHSEDLPFEFSFRVIDSPDVNAFALPGGFVTVNFGLLSSAESGEEVAGVIGHEIQHALLRHGTKRILRSMGGSALLALIFGGTDFHAYAQMAGQLTELSYDRSQESEADARGADLLRTSGVDPSGLATFFKRLEEEAPSLPAMLSTHPDPGDRARLISEAAQGGSFQKLPSPKNIACH